MEHYTVDRSHTYTHTYTSIQANIQNSFSPLWLITQPLRCQMLFNVSLNATNAASDTVHFDGHIDLRSVKLIANLFSHSAQTWRIEYCYFHQTFSFPQNAHSWRESKFDKALCYEPILNILSSRIINIIYYGLWTTTSSTLTQLYSIVLLQYYIFTPFFVAGSPEMAFIHALAAAMVTSFIARACRDGQLASCGCSRGSRPKQLHDDWTWGGCGDNLEYAYKWVFKGDLAKIVILKATNVLYI